jgi:hypothetical protein
MVPDTLKTVAFIEKDTKRFPDTHGWAYAQWAYDAETDTFKPSEINPSGTECGFSRHIQKGEGEVFGGCRQPA